MTKVKMCGLSRDDDIRFANEIMPDYVGFVFWKKSRRYVSDEQAAILKDMLDKNIKAVGVFLDEEISHIVKLVRAETIDIIQLHGHEDEDYIRNLKAVTDAPIIQAFVVSTADDLKRANTSSADYILVDSGTGSGRRFDWKLLAGLERPYFLAGGLNCENVGEAIKQLHPYAVDVSSGIETDGVKDSNKMREFMNIALTHSNIE